MRLPSQRLRRGAGGPAADASSGTSPSRLRTGGAASRGPGLGPRPTLLRTRWGLCLPKAGVHAASTGQGQPRPEEAPAEGPQPPPAPPRSPARPAPRTAQLAPVSHGLLTQPSPRRPSQGLSLPTFLLPQGTQPAARPSQAVGVRGAPVSLQAPFPGGDTARPASTQTGRAACGALSTRTSDRGSPTLPPPRREGAQTGQPTCPPGAGISAGQGWGPGLKAHRLRGHLDENPSPGLDAPRAEEQQGMGNMWGVGGWGDAVSMLAAASQGESCSPPPPQPSRLLISWKEGEQGLRRAPPLVWGEGRPGPPRSPPERHLIFSGRWRSLPPGQGLQWHRVPRPHTGQCEEASQKAFRAERGSGGRGTGPQPGCRSPFLGLVRVLVPPSPPDLM